MTFYLQGYKEYYTLANTCSILQTYSTQLHMHILYSTNIKNAYSTSLVYGEIYLFSLVKLQ